MKFALTLSFVDAGDAGRYPGGMNHSSRSMRGSVLGVSLAAVLVSGGFGADSARSAPAAASGAAAPSFGFPRLPKADPPKSSESSLEKTVFKRARLVARLINARPEGYELDGWNDCYGFMRRVWDPILSALDKPKLPVDTYVDARWLPIRSWNELLPGDVLATHQGHRWGKAWHGGLYAGKKGGKFLIFDSSSSLDGAYVHEPRPGLLLYYYGPTHKLLARQRASR